MPLLPRLSAGALPFPGSCVHSLLAPCAAGGGTLAGLPTARLHATRTPQPAHAYMCRGAGRGWRPPATASSTAGRTADLPPWSLVALQAPRPPPNRLDDAAPGVVARSDPRWSVRRDRVHAMHSRSLGPGLAGRWIWARRRTRWRATLACGGVAGCAGATAAACADRLGHRAGGLEAGWSPPHATSGSGRTWGETRPSANGGVSKCLPTVGINERRDDSRTPCGFQAQSAPQGLRTPCPARPGSPAIRLGTAPRRPPLSLFNGERLALAARSGREPKPAAWQQAGRGRTAECVAAQVAVVAAAPTQQCGPASATSYCGVPRGPSADERRRATVDLCSMDGHPTRPRGSEPRAAYRAVARQALRQGCHPPWAPRTPHAPMHAIHPCAHAMPPFVPASPHAGCRCILGDGASCAASMAASWPSSDGRAGGWLATAI